MVKTWDIVQPKNNWERNVALLYYQLNGLQAVGSKKISIKQIFYCMYCGAENTHWRWTCASCDAKEDIEQERMHDE